MKRTDTTLSAPQAKEAVGSERSWSCGACPGGQSPSVRELRRPGPGSVGWSVGGVRWGSGGAVRAQMSTAAPAVMNEALRQWQSTSLRGNLEW